MAAVLVLRRCLKRLALHVTIATPRLQPSATVVVGGGGGAEHGWLAKPWGICGVGVDCWMRIAGLAKSEYAAVMYELGALLEGVQ